MFGLPLQWKTKIVYLTMIQSYIYEHESFKSKYDSIVQIIIPYLKKHKHQSLLLDVLRCTFEG